jgi:hypothetical protein
MARLKIFPPLSHGIRESDAWGGGKFGDSRLGRMHKGIDYLAAPGECVRCPVNGVVRRIGYPYSDTQEYRLIEIDTGGAWVRVFYVEPDVHTQDYVVIGDLLGYAQDIAKRYNQPLREMKNHVHLEVRLRRGVLVGKGQEPDDPIWVDPSLFMY